jgi:hypothetical protein
MGFALVVGVVFGCYRARRAVKRDPIEAISEEQHAPLPTSQSQAMFEPPPTPRRSTTAVRFRSDASH